MPREALKDSDHALEKAYRQSFADFEQLELPEAVYLRGSDIRARFRLKMPDALHLAAAQHYGCDALWTNDGRLYKASHGLARNVVATH
jgi:predicted nucleic acid-binding protein